MLVSSTDIEVQPALQRLDTELETFYNRADIREYYAFAHGQNRVWNNDSPHALLWELCKPGDRVLDVGCGSAHAADNLKRCNVRYVGLDWSQEQIEANRLRLGPDCLFSSGSLYDFPYGDAEFDLVFSLYVLEHAVWPDKLLAEMRRVTRPGGMVFILCPEFRRFGRLPSFRYGFSVAPIKEKIRSGRWLDALVHLLLRTFYYPLKLKRLNRPFLINLVPTCLAGPYYTDNDAVYLACRKEVLTDMIAHGFQDVTADYAATPQSLNRQGALLGIFKKPDPD